MKGTRVNRCPDRLSWLAAIAAWAILVPSLDAQEATARKMAPMLKFEAFDAPRPVREPRTMDRRYFLTMGILAAAKSADAFTTERMLERGGHETNPLFGLLPSRRRIIGVNLEVLAAEASLAYALKRWGRDKWWSRAWLIDPAWGVGAHIRMAIRNERIPDLPGHDWRRP